MLSFLVNVIFTMLLIDQLAEARIAEALSNGDFENLEGMGKPLKLDDDSMIPAELRTACRIMKNSGFLPPELEMRRKIQDLRQLLEIIDDPQKVEATREKLNLLKLKLVLAGSASEKLALDLDGEYAQKLGRRLQKKGK